MNEKMMHLCVTKELFNPANIWLVRWINEDNYEAFSKPWGKGVQGWTLEEWRRLQKEGYSYCGVLLNGNICSIAGVWKRACDVWEVIAVGTKEKYRRQGMAKSVVSFITEYILQHVNVASYTSRESNIASIRTAQSVGFRYCTNIVDHDKWCAKNRVYAKLGGNDLTPRHQDTKEGVRNKE